MQELFSQIVEQNKRIIEQNRRIQESLDNLDRRIESLEQKAKFANAVGVVNNRSIAMMSNVGNIFDDAEQEEALRVVKNMKEEEEVSISTLIDLSRAKYI